MKDGLGFKNKIEWKAIHADGTVFDTGVVYNQVQTLVKEEVIDALNDDASFAGDIIEMAVGTSTGQGAADAALASLVSYETLSSQTQPTSTSLQNVASFTNISNTVTEAGLFYVTGCASGMYFYNDGLSVALTASDTLQITWTVNCTGT